MKKKKSKMPNYSLNCFHLKKIRKKTCYLNPTKTSFKKTHKKKLKKKQPEEEKL